MLCNFKSKNNTTNLKPNSINYTNKDDDKNDENEKEEDQSDDDEDNTSDFYTTEGDEN